MYSSPPFQSSVVEASYFLLFFPKKGINEVKRRRIASDKVTAEMGRVKKIRRLPFEIRRD